MFFFDTRTSGERRADDARVAKERMAKKASAIPWDPNMPFQSALKIQGSTYQQPSLFKVHACKADEADPNAAYKNNKNKLSLSKTKEWAYRERILSANTTLETMMGKKRGVVCFDSEVIIPMLHRGRLVDGEMVWDGDPFMSFTPLEFFSLRPGIRLAKGHVVIAGLGMGYQLEQVCKKKRVDRVTLVEKSEDLVEWILPKIDLHGKPIEVVVGDAYQIVPNLNCDVALIDIFKGYGNNKDEWESMVYLHKKELKKRGMEADGNIGKLWIWGA